MQHYLDDPNFKGIPALLATAQNSIKLPAYDFMQLLAAMKFEYKNVTFDGETGFIFGAKACRHYRFDNITFGFGSLEFEVPVFYFTREIKGKCHLLIEKNSDDQDANYYLGGPFLRAFMVLLDMDKNRVGFANKINNYGAEILGEGAPGPARPKNEHGLDRKEDPEDDDVHDNTGDQTGTDVPVDDPEGDDGLGKIIDDARKEHSRQTKGDNKTSVIVFVIVVLLVMAFIIVKCIVQKRKKEEDQESTFSQTTKEDLVRHQEKKNPPGKKKKSKKKKQTTIQNDESYDEDVEEKLDESVVITEQSLIEDEDSVLPIEQSTKEEDKENNEEE